MYREIEQTYELVREREREYTPHAANILVNSIMNIQINYLPYTAHAFPQNHTNTNHFYT